VHGATLWQAISDKIPPYVETSMSRQGRISTLRRVSTQRRIWTRRQKTLNNALCITLYACVNIGGARCRKMSTEKTVLGVFRESLKANRTLAFIRRNLKSQVKLDVYNVFIKPILNYAAKVWTPHSRCHLNRLEAIQNAALFIVSDYRRTSSVSAIKNSLSIRSIETQHEQLRLMMLHGLSNLQMPNCIIPSARTTRGNGVKFIQPPAQVDSYKFSFFPRSVHLWNRLKIDETITLHDFRNLIIVLYSILSFTIKNK